jgi:hypothetical protein
VRLHLGQHVEGPWRAEERGERLDFGESAGYQATTFTCRFRLPSANDSDLASSTTVHEVVPTADEPVGLGNSKGGAVAAIGRHGTIASIAKASAMVIRMVIVRTSSTWRATSAI